MTKRKGFELRELRLCGPAIPTAQLVFTQGLNVIEGASDTGKSYAVNCIDFLLGAKDAPEEIPETHGYDVAYLVIEAREDGQQFTLKRALVGGQIRVYQGPIDDAIESVTDSWQALGVTAKAKKSVSRFLLELCDLAGKQVRSNVHGKTKLISFRVLAKALIVDEQRIIAKRSPLYGTQRSDDTAAKNTIRLLLTGMDDSEIVEPEDRKVAAGRLAGKKEVVEALIEQDEDALEGLLTEDQPGHDELPELDQVLAEITDRTTAALQDLRDAEATRRKAWRSRRDAEERLRDLDGMVARAALLSLHYASDLRRLEAMVESAQVLGHYSEDACTYCGANPENQKHHDTAALEKLIEAARFEAVKVKRLAKELDKAQHQMVSEQQEVHSRIESMTENVTKLSRSISEELAPRTQETVAELRAMQKRHGTVIRVMEIRARVETLRTQLTMIEESGGTREKLEFAKLTAGIMSGVCNEASFLLDAWGFANKPTVTYDEKSADLHIDGRTRVSHGKGIRAVTCAAFVIAIMRHGLRNELGHPGFVVVDTPLNPYKAADVADAGAVTQPVKQAFYRHLCKTSPGQVIVFENEAAPEDVRSACNYLHFSGNNESGRQGFIPVKRS